MSESFSEPVPLPATIREFLYADLDRARSLMSQIVGGVPEGDTVGGAVSKKFAVGIRNYLGYAREGKTEDHIQRSLLDALFPELESILESEGWLTDITDRVSSPSITPQQLEDEFPPGCLVKIHAEGQLFDTRYLAEVWGGTSVAASGVHAIAHMEEPPQKITRGKKPRPSTRSREESQEQSLEDLIEDFDPEALGGITPAFLRNMVRVTRGMFMPGLHLLLRPKGSVGWSIPIRLQEGKRYLDAEREVLFSRYGLAPQGWTALGTIGHYAASLDDNSIPDQFDFVRSSGAIDRKKFITGMNDFLSVLARQGISDSPAHPGFSLVPVAVYRSIPRPGSSSCS